MDNDHYALLGSQAKYAALAFASGDSFTASQWKRGAENDIITFDPASADRFGTFLENLPKDFSLGLLLNEELIIEKIPFSALLNEAQAISTNAIRPEDISRHLFSVIGKTKPDIGLVSFGGTDGDDIIIFGVRKNNKFAEWFTRSFIENYPALPDETKAIMQQACFIPENLSNGKTLEHKTHLFQAIDFAQNAGAILKGFLPGGQVSLVTLHPGHYTQAVYKDGALIRKDMRALSGKTAEAVLFNDPAFISMQEEMHKTYSRYFDFDPPLRTIILCNQETAARQKDSQKSMRGSLSVAFDILEHEFVTYEEASAQMAEQPPHIHGGNNFFADAFLSSCAIKTPIAAMQGMMPVF